MGVKAVLCFIVFALLFFAFAAVDSEGKRGEEELSLDNQLYSAFGGLNDDLAVQLWVHCEVELLNAEEAVEDLELYVPEEKYGINNGIISSSTLLAKEDIQKAILVLHPQGKRTLLDCLRKNNIPYLVSGEESHTKNWYTKYLEFLFARTDAHRRRQLLQSFAPAPASAPTVESPKLKPVSSISKSNKQDSIHQAVVIAVVVTAAVTFVFAALVFSCYYRSHSGLGRNNEKPLLSLSLSSSHKSSSAFGSSINKGELNNQSFNTSLNNNKMASSLDDKFSVLESDILNASKADTQSLGTIADAAKISAEASARISPSSPKPPPGLPPLKPLPGRVDHSTPEPPPLKPPPGKAAPPSQLPPGSPQAPPPTGPPPPPIPSSIKIGPRPPPPPPIPSGIKTGPRPPPPPKSGVPPPRPPTIGLKLSPLGSNHPSGTAGEGGEADSTKTKLKPFFWDKVLTNPDHSMVWHELKSGSFQFNEEMIETLFGYAPPEKNKNDPKKEASSKHPAMQYIQLIESKKAQNLSILLRALNVTTEEVCDALQEGNELPSELLQTLLKMAPTSEEELKLRLFSGELSRLGPADRFLKALVDVPFAFRRLETLLFMCTLQEDATIIKESFTTFEAACTELKKSRLFLKLLEAVLKTGNRMNDGTFRGGAHAFKLDTLLKLSDVKGTDGKTTLLHFVVQEIIRSEGVRAARVARESQSMSSIRSEDLLEDALHNSEDEFRSLGLQVISGLSSELKNVKKAAVLDGDILTGNVAKLGHQLVKARDFLNSDMKNIDEGSGFNQVLKNFVQNAEIDIMSLLEDENRIMTLIRHVKTLKICQRSQIGHQRGRARQYQPSPDPHQSPDLRQRLFPAIKDRRMDYSSSDDDL
ncbi:hypothetical protein HYC85_020377 [Camellia sinensis]|uniref:Formin-like protein n=1 Tax=Camellia sinensis TaxID=4442 RepID=A0A7J7GRA4_CAMSI|nr:hypothetical protein HYC85_020377 [Camellia sinensis]